MSPKRPAAGGESRKARFYLVRIYIQGEFWMDNGDNKSRDSKKLILDSKALDMVVSKLKDGTFHEILDDWKWILSYSKRYKWAILYYMILGIVSSSLGLISSEVSKNLIDIVTGYQTSKLPIMIGLMIGSTVFGLVCNSLISRVSAKISIYINNDIQADIFDKIMDSEWLELSKYSNGDIMNRFNSDVNTVSSNAISWLPSIIINVYNFVATFCLMMHHDMVMALIALASAPFLLLTSRILIKRMRQYNKKMKEMNSKLMTFEVETFYNMDTIKSFGIEEKTGKKLRWWQRKYKDVSLDYNWFTIKTNVALSAISTAVQFVAFGYCLWRLWGGMITYGQMTQFLQLRSNLSSTFSGMVSLIPNALTSSVSAHRIKEIVDLPKETHIVKESQAIGAKSSSGYSVEIRGADFAYVENQKVITNSDFIARPNEIVALVGPSGEGKTTIIRMILGLIHPEKGEAVLRDMGGKEVLMNAELRQYFAYVPQGNTILSGTIAENMRMVREDATDEEIIEALKIACAWDFVSKLKEGINNPVGERGRGLSEGQAQRIAIARAVLRDAPILLLDEATSALDVVTERNVLKNIIRQRPNKTCIVTTHRPSVLNMCQRVYRVMDKQVRELSEEESAQMVMDF